MATAKEIDRLPWAVPEAGHRHHEEDHHCAWCPPPGTGPDGRAWAEAFVTEWASDPGGDASS